MLNGTADFLVNFSNLTGQLTQLAFVEKPAEQLANFSFTCNEIIKITVEEQHHPDMGDAFKTYLPCLVQLTNKCNRLSQLNIPEAMAYARFTEALLEVFEHCSSGIQQQYLPLYIKIPDAVIQKQSTYFETHCIRLLQRWSGERTAKLIQIAIQPLCSISVASPLQPFSFFELQEAHKHLYNLETANTEKELLSVLYGIGYNTDAFVHWLVQYLLQEMAYMPFVNTRKEYLETTAQEIQMARFNPILKRPAESFYSNNASLFDCMAPFFSRQLKLLEGARDESFTGKINIETDSMPTLAWLLRLLFEALGCLHAKNLARLLGIVSPVFSFKGEPVTDPGNFGYYAQPKHLNADTLNRLAYILETALQKVREWQQKLKRKDPDADKE